MFEILGIVDFRHSGEAHQMDNPLLRCDIYNDLKFTSRSFNSRISSVHFMERTETSENAYMNEGMQVFLYGTCFTNKRYQHMYSRTLAKLSAADIYGLYKTHEDNLTDYVKGMFTLVIINIRDRTAVLIADRTNLLPLYYSFRNNVLVFSSSLNALLDNDLIEKKINAKALVKLALFGYVPGNETIIENVFMQSYASRIKVTRDNLTEDRYWDITEIITHASNRLGRSDALRECNRLMLENVMTYVADQDFFALTFTGGYDSRAVFSALRRDRREYFCYSYGIDECFDIRIPRDICHELGVDYRGFLLNDQFEADFDRYALKAVYYSDGLASITKANHVYPCEMISDSVDVILTGLFGSEIIKQPTSLGYYVNAGIRELLFSKSPYPVFKRLLEKARSKQYLCEEMFDGCECDIFDEIRERYLSGKPDKFSFYFFVFREGIRKYFMQQLKIERMYVENRHPFLDDDFLTLIFRTPFAGIYNIKKNKSIMKAWGPHLVYAHIIRENSPKLAKYITTHGYRPIDILSYSGMPRALWGYYHNRNNIRTTKTFDYKKWVHSYCVRHMEELDYQSEVFGDDITKHFENGFHMSNVEEFSRFLSLRLWFRHHGL